MMYKITGFIFIALFVSACNVNDSTAEAADSKNLESIPLDLTTHLGDQQKFVDGDEIQFLLSLGQDAYIYMYYIDAANNITQILPNKNQRSNFYKAGYFLTIPEYENLYRFTISEPFGYEAIWVFASDRSITITRAPDSVEKIKQLIKRSSNISYGEYVLNIVTMQQ